MAVRGSCFAEQQKREQMEMEQKFDTVVGLGRERRYVTEPRQKYTRPRLMSELFRTAATHPDPVSYLRANRHPAVVAVLRALHRQWMVTDQPRHQTNRFQDSPTLYENYQRLYLWLDGSPIQDAFERNKLFDNWLSEMEAGASQFILGVRRGSSPIRQDIVRQAFPEREQQHVMDQNRGHHARNMSSSFHALVAENTQRCKELSDRLRANAEERENLPELYHRTNLQLMRVRQQLAEAGGANALGNGMVGNSHGIAGAPHTGD
jgi:hypothetical protein